jgi:hypothetical protein
MSAINRYRAVAMGIFLALVFAIPTYAQLQTTVTVKNNTSSPITLDLAGEPLSYYMVGTASPTPEATIAANSSNIFVVTSTYPNIGAIHLYYDTSATTEACSFNTSYTSGGYTQFANSKGRTTCTALITSIDPNTNDWSVLFTLTTY